MKCKQRLCQRNNNLKNSSNCNVCEEAITASFTEIHPEKVVETVQTYPKLMISTHVKLVEKDVVNVLLLRVVINILSQHDNIPEMGSKMKSIEVENITNKSRIESLENWIMIIEWGLFPQTPYHYYYVKC